jgi:hypothetical protein
MMGKYAGKTLTVLNSDFVYDVICINEDDGYSETLKQDPNDEDGYILRVLDSSDEDYWLIGDSHIDELLEEGAITIS